MSSKRLSAQVFLQILSAEVLPDEVTGCFSLPQNNPGGRGIEGV